MNLIVVADDVGLAPSVDRAVLEALRLGCISIPSVMPCGNSFPQIANLLSDRGIGEISWHVTLGEPLQRAASGQCGELTDGDGFFCDREQTAAVLNSPDMKVRRWLYHELQAQLSRLLEHRFRIVHICGHRHFHLLPLVREVLHGIWQERGLLRPIVRGYDLELSTLDCSKAYSIILPNAESAAEYFSAVGWPRTITIGFAWGKDPLWQRLREEIGEALSLICSKKDGAGIELMLHMAQYETDEIALSMNRDSEFREYTGIFRQGLLAGQGLSLRSAPVSAEEFG